MYASGSLVSENRADILFSNAGAANGSKSRQPQHMADDARVCDCNNVTKAQIIEAVLQGARSIGAVCDATRASTGCGSCRPEVEAIVALACERLEPGARGADVASRAPEPNRIEKIKLEKDGLDVAADLQKFARDGWESISDSDRERLKWLGVFFRRQTPGRFMMRLRMPNGITNSAQLKAIAELCEQRGTGFVDITTRQQIQLRGFAIGDVPHIWERLTAVELVSLQTGMDNIRNVVGCPVAGIGVDELFDASPVVREFTNAFLKNKAFTNLPRKFNVAITACTASCTHAETQDVALTPAVKIVDGEEMKGFNVSVGGKVGSGGLRLASPLGVFVRPEMAAALCSHITLIFRDYGSRRARNRARLAFLIDAWGVERFRGELERRVGHRLMTAGRDVRTARHADHLGVSPQRQPGLHSVGLSVPVGRITARQLSDVARLAEVYGAGDVRITTGQNLIIPNVAASKLQQLLGESIFDELPHDPSGLMRGLVSCTGIDYCHMALVETKELAMKTARELEQRIGSGRKLLTMHWSGCPAGCGNHSTADIGLLGKNVKIGDEVVDAVDVFVGGRSGPDAKAGARLLEDVPCSELASVLERIIPYVSNKRALKEAVKSASANVSKA